MHNLYSLGDARQEQVVDFVLTPQPTTQSPHHLADDDLAFDFPPNNGSTPVRSASKSTTLTHLIPRLDALLAVLKTCKGRVCTHPWSTLHPEDDVNTLHDALDARFNGYYEEQLKDQRVHFLQCEKGYIAESESPGEVKPFGHRMMVDEIAF